MSRINRIPLRFRHADVHKVSKKVFPMVLDYSKRLKEMVAAGVGLLLAGPPGVGKTYAIAALTRAASEQFDSCPWDFEFATAPELFDNISIIENEVDPLRGITWTRTYCSVPWLVINDLGKEYRGGKLSEQAAYKLGRILRTRCERQLVTHITTNMAIKPDSRYPNMDSLLATYGDSILSLLKESVLVYEVEGPDRRQVHI